MEATMFKKIKRSSSSTIPMHKKSHSITKSKPRIRIIHIFAPEVIQTDVANFRELVQSLTGKPDDLYGFSKANPKRNIHHGQVQDMINMKKLKEPNHGDQNDNEEISMKTWNDINVNGDSYGGFLNGLGDFEGFIQELDDFPYMPFSMDASASSTSSSSSLLHGGSTFLDSHHQFV